MIKRNKPQYAAIEYPLSNTIPDIFCPICGHCVFNADLDSDNPGVNPCIHLAFVFEGESGSFEYASDNFNKKTEEFDVEGLWMEGEMTFDNFHQFLDKAGYDNKMLALEVTYGSMACGPVFYSVIFGFDYEYGHTVI